MASLPQSRKEVLRLAGLPAVHSAFHWFVEHERELADEQLEITAVAAPPFHEQERARLMLRKFSEAGLEQAHSDDIGNVIGHLPGSGEGPFVVVAAHLDTVFSDTQLQVHRDGDLLSGPGISDNGAGLVGLLAVARAIRAAGLRTRLPILFLANVGEEGEGDLRGMRHFFVDQRWQGRIGCMLALDGAGTDTIIADALGSRRFEICITGPGGHSWTDFGIPNPIVLLARIIERLSRIGLSQEPRTTLNVGVIEGGTSVNAIPQSALMRVDVRSTDPRKIGIVEAQVRDVVDEIMRSAREPSALDAHVRLIGDRPAGELPSGAPILEALRAVDAQLGIASHLHCASTDANIPLSMGVEAIAIGAGGSGARAHTLHEWFNPRGRDIGLKRILLALLTLAALE